MKLGIILLFFWLASWVVYLVMAIYAIMAQDVEALMFFALASTLGMMIIGLIGLIGSKQKMLRE